MVRWSNGPGVGVGVRVGSGVSVGVTVGCGVGKGAGVAVGSGAGVGSGVGMGVAVGTGVAVGVGVGASVGDGATVGASVGVRVDSTSAWHPINASANVKAEKTVANRTMRTQFRAFMIAYCSSILNPIAVSSFRDVQFGKTSSAMLLKHFIKLINGHSKRILKCLLPSSSYL